MQCPYNGKRFHRKLETSHENLKKQSNNALLDCGVVQTSEHLHSRCNGQASPPTGCRLEDTNQLADDSQRCWWSFA